MRCIPPNQAPNIEIVEKPASDPGPMLPLSSAKALAERRGFATEESDGLLLFSRDGARVGVALMHPCSGEGGEQEVSLKVVERITGTGNS